MASRSEMARQITSEQCDSVDKALSPPLTRTAVVSQLGYGGAERQTVELLRELCGTPWAPTQVVCLSEELTPYARYFRTLAIRFRSCHDTQASTYDVIESFDGSWTMPTFESYTR